MLSRETQPTFKFASQFSLQIREKILQALTSTINSDVVATFHHVSFDFSHKSSKEVDFKITEHNIIITVNDKFMQRMRDSSLEGDALSDLVSAIKIASIIRQISDNVNNFLTEDHPVETIARGLDLSEQVVNSLIELQQSYEQEVQINPYYRDRFRVLTAQLAIARLSLELAGHGFGFILLDENNFIKHTGSNSSKQRNLISLYGKRSSVVPDLFIAEPISGPQIDRGGLTMDGGFGWVSYTRLKESKRAVAEFIADVTRALPLYLTSPVLVEIIHASQGLLEIFKQNPDAILEGFTRYCIFEELSHIFDIRYFYQGENPWSLTRSRPMLRRMVQQTDRMFSEIADSWDISLAMNFLVEYSACLRAFSYPDLLPFHLYDISESALAILDPQGIDEAEKIRCKAQQLCVSKLILALSKQSSNNDEVKTILATLKKDMEAISITEEDVMSERTVIRMICVYLTPLTRTRAGIDLLQDTARSLFASQFSVPFEIGVSVQDLERIRIEAKHVSETIQTGHWSRISTI